MIDAPYGDERFAVYMFLPTNVEPPYQTTIIFPNGAAVFPGSFDEWPTEGFDYLVMSGRAVAFPILDETFERNTGLVRVVLVNQATDRIERLYRQLGYTLRFLEAPRRISCTGNRKPALEVLATRNL
jgi:hypothetical protein